MVRPEVPVVIDGEPSAPGRALMVGGFVAWWVGAVEIVRGTLAHLQPEVYRVAEEAMSPAELYIGLGAVAAGAGAFLLGIRVENAKG